jgi:cell division protein FtsB
MKVDCGIWERLSRLIMMLLIIAALLGVAVWYLPEIQKNEEKRREILIEEAKVQRAREINRQLQAEIDAHDDPLTVERLARERLRYARPGETVIRFRPEPQSDTRPGPRQTP